MRKRNKDPQEGIASYYKHFSLASGIDSQGGLSNKILLLFPKGGTWLNTGKGSRRNFSKDVRLGDYPYQISCVNAYKTINRKTYFSEHYGRTITISSYIVKPLNGTNHYGYSICAKPGHGFLLPAFEKYFRDVF